MFLFLISNETDAVCTVSVTTAEVVYSCFYIILLDGIIPKDVTVVGDQRTLLYMELILGVWGFCFVPAKYKGINEGKQPSKFFIRARTILVMQGSEVAELGISAGPVRKLQS